MLCIGGFDGYFKLVNPAWQRVLGYTAEELTSSPWLDFVHPDDRDATIREGENLSGGEKVIRFENRYVRSERCEPLSLLGSSTSICCISFRRPSTESLSKPSRDGKSRLERADSTVGGS